MATSSGDCCSSSSYDGGGGGGSGGGGNGEQERSNCCFLEWMKLQEQDLSELLQALNATPRDDAELAGLTDKAIRRFESYMEQRLQLSSSDPAAFFAPTWCTPWENSLLWIAGCRPSSYFRLIYAITSVDIEANLADFLRGSTASDLGELSSKQVRLIDELQRRTIKEEEKLSATLAVLQEDVADQPVATIVKWARGIGEPSTEADKALDDHERAMARALKDADRLRLSTVKKILAILTGVQGVDFLAMSKKLHLCIHKWSQMRDQKHGRSENR